MRLCTIYIVWDDWDLWKKSYYNILPVVDGVILVASTIGNSGEESLLPQQIERIMQGEIIFHHGKEVDKRNSGIQRAIDLGYTHFILMDADEFYLQSDIERDKAYLESHPEVTGLVYRLNVLFGKPTLWCEDHTLVPGIHKLKNGVKTGSYKTYPFAYDEKGNAHIDPTRRLSYFHGIEMGKTIMWHASWIREDVEKKIRNSPARRNLEKSNIRQDLANAAPGYYCQFYRQRLKECENIFNI